MTSTAYDQPPTVFGASAFRGRVYGVTGSAHGIGEATVKHLARLGASVVVMDFDKSDLRRVEADLKTSNASALCLLGDVADRGFLKQAIRMAHKRWGRIDGWVNNTPYNPGGMPDDLPLRALERTWQVNTVSAWVACGLLMPIMKKQGGGSIVSMSSIMAHLPHSHNTAYAMAKSAVEGMTRGLAVDLAPFHIRVNAVVPGAINTLYDARNFHFPPGIPAAVIKNSMALRERLRQHSFRPGQPWPLRGEARDVADVILFLLSDAARFVTGACVPVDGGASGYRPYIGQLDLEEIVRDFKAHRALLAKYPKLRMRYLMRGRRKRIRGKKS